MRIWIRPRVCGGCRAQNLEILQLRGLQDLGTDWLWRRLLPGVCLSWLVWLYCPLTKHEYKEKEKIWRDQDSLVIYLEFLVTRGDIWEPVSSQWSQRYIWPSSVSAVASCALLPVLLCTFAKLTPSQNPVGSGLLVSKSPCFCYMPGTVGFSLPQPQPLCPFQVYSVFRPWL